MTSVFISYSHDSADPTHADRVARLATSLMQDGLTVFLDQNRGDEEEKLAWEIWMENQIEKAEYVLVVCTELYLKKVRQEVPPDEGQGVCWEAGIMYSLLCEEKRNTTKFLPVMFLPAQKQFIPRPLKGKQYFVLDCGSFGNRRNHNLTSVRWWSIAPMPMRVWGDSGRRSVADRRGFLTWRCKACATAWRRTLSTKRLTSSAGDWRRASRESRGSLCLKAKCRTAPAGSFRFTFRFS
jgi:hypothetical protein